VAARFAPEADKVYGYKQDNDANYYAGCGTDILLYLGMETGADTTTNNQIEQDPDRRRNKRTNNKRQVFDPGSRRKNRNWYTKARNMSADDDSQYAPPGK